MLKLENVSIYRDELCVAESISNEFVNGKVYAILGPNGAGKSSLLSAIFGSLSFSGNIYHKENKLTIGNHYIWQKKLGFMPQENNVDASLSALECVLLGLMNELGMYVSDEQLKLALGIMDELGILHLAQRDILSLSGGQRQMVMFASVLMKQPQILLLDEPVSALDLHHQCVLLECVRSYTEKNALITIVILHDLNLAAQFADELVLLNEAKIKAGGKAKEVLTKEIVEGLYKISADIFYDEDNKPVICVKKACRNNK